MSNFPYGEPTPEMIEQLQEEHNKKQIFIEEFRHSVQRIFEELSLDDLTTLRGMMAETHQNPVVAAVWEGMAAMALRTRFRICATCGVNHDDEFDNDK